MIVAMKKLTLLCLASDRDASLAALRDLGVLHLTPVAELRNPDLDQYRKALSEARLIQDVLAVYARKSEPAPPGETTEPAATEILARARDLLERKRQTATTLNELRQECQALEPYGDFDPAAVSGLAAQGIAVKLFHVSDKKPIIPPAGTCLCPLARDARGQYFALVGMAGFEFPVPEVPLPERALSAAVAARDQALSEQQEVERQLAVLSRSLPALQAHVADVQDRVGYLQAAAGGGAADEIAYLRGFCPVDDVARIRAAAATHGWGLVIADPAADDDVPTLIRNPAWVKPVNVIFSMLDVLPGYREVDIRSVFLIFFALFFAILVGDAGYGLIFLALTIFFRRKFRDAPAGPFRLVTLLSICTIVWGAITGNYFGCLHLPAPIRALLKRLPRPSRTRLDPATQYNRLSPSRPSWPSITAGPA